MHSTTSIGYSSGRLILSVLLLLTALLPRFMLAQSPAVVWLKQRKPVWEVNSTLGVTREHVTASDFRGIDLGRSLESAGADSTSHKSNRSRHIAIGVVAGLVGGVLVGKAVDGGRAGCGNEQRGGGGTCDWGSGLYEPVLGLVGAVIGGIVGAILPHT